MAKLILFQGDSITDCKRNREDDRFTGSGYATIVSGRLGLEYPGEYIFKNRGIGGNKVTDIYARIGPDILDLKPDYMSLIVGINDLFRDHLFCGGQRAERFERDYSNLIESILCELPNLKIFLMSPFVLPCDAFYEEYKQYEELNLPQLISDISLYREATKNVAARFSLPHADLQPKLDKAIKLAPAEFWTPDGVHLYPSGHEIIASEWLRLFEQVK
ncbi:MAG: SGNH/GDSL hydrolase family protein [Oscillospiraceae bacterium]|nr:SGNH/GDSL hydrolase family protein [Oscillospiraceae bacterium]